jgi:glycosyltransferase involved in cell wall biosynthesis
MSRVCVVSFKECWPDAEGRWHSSGGFPAQMTGLASLFDETTLVIVGTAPQAGGMPLPPHARVVPLPSPTGTDLRRKLSVAHRLPALVRTITRECRRADVVHTPLPGDIALLGFFIGLTLGKPVLARYGGSWTQTGATTLMNRVTRQSMRLAARGRNVMIATGTGERPPAAGMTWLFASAISRAEVAGIRPALDRPRSMPLRVIYPGRLSPEKGVRHLLGAMAALRRTRPEGAMPRLVLVGDGPERAELTAAAAAADCGDVVEFRGQLSRSALLAELCRGDVCVLPSLTESFCKARLDAMLCGVPVVTTEVGFGREIVGADGERGWIVPPGDDQALAAVLARLADGEGDWPAIRRRARAYAERFTIETWTEYLAEACARRWGRPLVAGKLQP